MKNEAWALLIARTWHEGRHEIAADILATLHGNDQQALALASKSADHPLSGDDGPLLESLHDILDETGFQSILKISKSRCKELKNLKPSMIAPKPGPV